jgi:hypothetical protein
MFSIGTNTREMMNVSRISRMVVWQFMCDDFGDLEMMSAQCVPS